MFLRWSNKYNYNTYNWKKYFQKLQLVTAPVCQFLLRALLVLCCIVHVVLAGGVFYLAAHLRPDTLHGGLLMALFRTLCWGWFLALFQSFLGGHIVGRLWGWILALVRSFLGEHVVGGLWGFR